MQGHELRDAAPVFPEDLQVAGHIPDRVVDVMGHARGKLSDAGHLVLLENGRLLGLQVLIGGFQGLAAGFDFPVHRVQLAGPVQDPLLEMFVQKNQVFFSPSAFGYFDLQLPVCVLLFFKFLPEALLGLLEASVHPAKNAVGKDEQTRA